MGELIKMTEPLKLAVTAKVFQVDKFRQMAVFEGGAAVPTGEAIIQVFNMLQPAEKLLSLRIVNSRNEPLKFTGVASNFATGEMTIILDI